VGWSTEITIYFNVIEPGMAWNGDFGGDDTAGMLEKLFFQSKFVPLPSLI
jgi:hypothetical protein